LLSKLKSVYSNSEFFKNVFYQMVGIGLAQLLPFAVTPVLTRLYSEADFALYTSFFAVASILVVGVGGRYQFAIVLPQKNTEAIRIFTLSIYLTIAYTVLLIVVSIIVGAFLTNPLSHSVYYIPYLSVRNKTFLHNATAKVLQSVFYVVPTILMGVLNLTSVGLIAGRIFGVIGSWFFLQRKSMIKPVFTKIRSLYQVAGKYKDYPKYGLIPAFLDIASVQGLALILTEFYSVSDLGYFGLTALVLSAPLGLVGGSFKDVFYQKITALINSKDFHRALSFFYRSALGLLLLGLPICLAIRFWGVEIFKIVFGDKWARSGELAALLSFSFLIQLIVSPLSSVFNAATKLKTASVWQSVYFVTTFSTLGLCATYFKLSLDKLIFVYVVHEIVLYSAYFLLEIRTLKKLS